MRSGIVFGTAGMVDNIVGAIRAEIGGGARVIATGERMDYVLEKCKTQITFDNDLLMEGLYYIYRRNT
jgi:type III pantothenate kinase